MKKKGHCSFLGPYRGRGRVYSRALTTKSIISKPVDKIEPPPPLPHFFRALKLRYEVDDVCKVRIGCLARDLYISSRNPVQLYPVYVEVVKVSIIQFSDKGGVNSSHSGYQCSTSTVATLIEFKNPSKRTLVAVDNFPRFSQVRS